MKRWGFALVLVAGCSIAQQKIYLPEEAPLAVATHADDYSSYAIHRVGLLPFDGESLDAQQAAAFQTAFSVELAPVAPFEIVALDPRDVEEVSASQPHRRGFYQPKTIIELARRYRLDALLVGTVTQLRSYPPQLLGLQIELISAETGQSIWSSALSLDSSDERVKRSIDVWCNNQREGTIAPENADLVLLSPSRFARFAAHEIARVF